MKEKLTANKQLSLDLTQVEDPRPVATTAAAKPQATVVAFPHRSPTSRFQDRVIEKLMRTRVLVSE
ncbi:hypothetical protein [Burkholderia glumae]|uniref:hypothetical protein n=1 Tax=Burkholderia glumae TaxID=337 RepID=UPI0021509ED8|nr:hypothetical protein [Burkholderia glumae]